MTFYDTNVGSVQLSFQIPWLSLLESPGMGVTEGLFAFCLSALPQGISLTVTERLQWFHASHLYTAPSRRKAGWFPKCLLEEPRALCSLHPCEGGCPPRLNGSRQAAGSFLNPSHTDDHRPRSLWAKRMDSPSWVKTVEAFPAAWVGSPKCSEMQEMIYTGGCSFAFLLNCRQLEIMK